MGLYSYTYSAGLSIATQLFKKLRKGKYIIDDWLAVLRAGGSKSPVELAQMVGVDITNKATLIDTIGFIGELVEQAEALTEQLAKESKQASV